AFEILTILVSHNGHLVEKDLLLKKVWPETFVEEANLTQNIFTLRKALGQHKDGNQYIETVPKRGYRFVANVRETPAEIVIPIEEKSIDEMAINTKTIPIEENGANPLAITQEEKNVDREKFNANREEIGLSLPVSSIAPKNRKIRRLVLSLVATIIIIGLILMLYSVWPATKQEAAKSETTTSLTVKSIAVLPFKNLNTESSDEYQGMAMADALITRLSNTGQIVVRQTSAILKYTGSQDPLAAGREQGVDMVLDGKIQRDSDSVRVTVQLVRVSDGVTLWADRFDEKFTNIFAVQDAISERVAQGMMLKLSGEEKKRLIKRYTENSEAYRAYLKGRFFWSKRTVQGLQKGVEYFQQAIEIDPSYALAYAGLADSYTLLGVYIALSPNDTFPKAKAAVQKALEIDDSLAEAHASLGAINLFYEWDWQGAEQEFKRAAELNPSYAYAHQWNGLNLAAMGRIDEAIIEMRHAQELDPLSLIINTNVGWINYYARSYDKAIEQCRKAMEMDANFARAHLRLGMAYGQKRMYPEAIAEYQKTLNLSGDDPYVMALLGYAYAASGQHDAARKTLNQLQELQKQRYVPPHSIALIYTGLGEKEQAFEWLEKAFRDRSGAMIYLRVEPIFDPLRSDPRLTDLLRRMRLTS
ncbi:MAG: winged helix-turn-helix domain-containing protein, partial [Acidobacteriota bacterium]